MQRKYLGFLVVLFCSLAFFSCEKEHSIETGGGPIFSQGTFRAKIDGVQWTADRIKSASIQNGVIAVAGLSMDGKSIVLRVADSGVHVYSFHNLSTTNVGAFVDSSIVPVSSMTTNQWLTDSLYGTMNVTSINNVRKTISGTFSMKVIRQIDGLHRDITDGVFTDIPYEPNTPPPAAADTFKAKIDGADFPGGSINAFSAMSLISISSTVNSATLGLSFSDAITLGTYPIEPAGAVNATYNSSTGDVYLPVTGSLVVLEHNTATNRVRGNFSFTASNLTNPGSPNISITNGYFSVGY
ncbi:MAG: hypothetical protein KF829_00535 [Ferruginibacter sp.]|nr:hypothetical protein [Ferruginibacter sp.]